MDSSHTLKRGVWSCPWRDEGGRVLLVAIDSRGRCIAGPARVFRREQRADVAGMLRRILDAADPPRVS